MAFADLVADVDRAVQGHLGSVTATYQPEAGEAVDVVVMFDEAYQLEEGNAHAGVEQLSLAVFVRVEDLPVHPDEDEPTLTIDGQSYRVRERQPDGMGGMRLLLHRSES